MSEVFGALYADTYDSLYRDKNYEEECDLLEQLWREHASSPVRSVLDLGCGTGGHALRLAARGYEVLGVDRSERMLSRARQKANALGLRERVLFHCADMRALELERCFDSVVVLFAALGYQATNGDVLAALRTSRAHLAPGGILVFDVWYGPAVLRERPEQRVKLIETEAGKMLRLSVPTLDVSAHLCRVTYRLWEIKGDRLVGETVEEHVVRFFFPRELELMLDVCGLSLRSIRAFPNVEVAADETTWNAVVVATAR